MVGFMLNFQTRWDLPVAKLSDWHLFSIQIIVLHLGSPNAPSIQMLKNFGIGSLGWDQSNLDCHDCFHQMIEVLGSPFSKVFQITLIHLMTKLPEKYNPRVEIRSSNVDFLDRVSNSDSRLRGAKRKPIRQNYFPHAPSFAFAEHLLSPQYQDNPWKKIPVFISRKTRQHGQRKRL